MTKILLAVSSAITIAFIIATIVENIRFNNNTPTPTSTSPSPPPNDGGTPMWQIYAIISGFFLLVSLALSYNVFKKIGKDNKYPNEYWKYPYE